MRKRNHQLNIRLTDEENNKLKVNSAKCGLTVSAYVRMLILGFQPKESPPKAYDETITSLTNVYTLLNNNSISEAKNVLKNTILQMQKQFILPEKLQNGSDNYGSN